METAEARYDQLVDRVEVLYEEGRPTDALAVLDAADEDLAPWFAELAHLRACLLGASGQADAALDALRHASDAGAWWAEQILVGDDDLADLQDRPEFQRIVEVSETRRTADPTPPHVSLPAAKPTGLVVALHGAGQRSMHAARDWAGVLELGYALVCVESSQLMSPMYRTWPDPEKAREDIARVLAELPLELRDLPTIAAGFSAGGRVALDWALTGTPVPVAGVVVLAPALRSLPAEAHGVLAPAVVLIGTDDDLVEVVDEAAGQLTSSGLTIEKLTGLGHAFPADFGPLRAAFSSASTATGA
ncbi:putative esterase [Kribbella amoyensis]|uniref:Putative esterase n=1 Tax=Kribbella amoyensis TaxID=996641 RepID=A0A561BP47_9ACTN|nr:phospholipase [Kribbella amoyensis]TWD80648.1 putative esterase [Kribbella amoyensis]